MNGQPKPTTFFKDMIHDCLQNFATKRQYEDYKSRAENILVHFPKSDRMIKHQNLISKEGLNFFQQSLVIWNANS